MNTLLVEVIKKYYHEFEAIVANYQDRARTGENRGIRKQNKTDFN